MAEAFSTGEWADSNNFSGLGRLRFCRFLWRGRHLHVFLSSYITQHSTTSTTETKNSVSGHLLRLELVRRAPAPAPLVPPGLASPLAALPFARNAASSSACFACSANCSSRASFARKTLDWR